MRKPVGLSIGGFDSGSGAGVETDIKVFESLGLHGTGVVTALTAQGLVGIRSVSPVNESFLKTQLDTVIADFPVSVIKTGMITGRNQMEVVSNFLGRTLTVCDPVLKAKDGTTLIDDLDTYVDRILRKCHVVTPNVPEAEVLSNEPVKGVDSMKEIAEDIAKKFGTKYVIVKGGHLGERLSQDVLYADGNFHVFQARRLEETNTHGTGSVFSTALGSFMVRGHTIVEAVRLAKEYVTLSIENSLGYGKGIGPVDPMTDLLKRAEKFKVIEEMNRVRDFILSRRDFIKLIPEVQSNVAHSIESSYVKGLCDIATFSGRITKTWRGEVKVGLPVVFCSPTHTARMLASVISKGEKATVLVNIKYSEEIIQAFSNIGLEPFRVDREKEPQGPEGRTMDWIVDYSYRQLGHVPKVIFDEGARGKEPMVRFWSDSVGRFIETLDRVLNLMRD